MLTTEQKNISDTLVKIGNKFRIEGNIYSYDILDIGHINTTIKVIYFMEGKGIKAYLFQKVNTFVFRYPEKIMENIDKVTSYIRKCEEGKCQASLHFHHTNEGKNYTYDDDGGFWRVMNYIESITYDTSDQSDIIYGVGKAFGQFQRQLSGFDGSTLYETIPDFHNTRKRLDTFFTTYENCTSERKNEVKNEAEYLYSVREKACELWDRYSINEFPVRVTHNDTKANNVLFDKKTNKPIVVIDLDTVMPGMAMYDFGDAVRFIANTALEDEPDLSKVHIDIDKFSLLTNGFLSEVAGKLTVGEISSLVLASFAITVELASRFCDDYLKSDVYFKIEYPKHNLVRTRCQLALAKDIMNNYNDLQKIVKKSYSEQLKEN